MYKNRKRGFSLVELVVVILIIGIIAAVGIGVGTKQLSSARIKTVSNNLKLISSDIETAVIDMGFLESIENQDNVKNYFEKWSAAYLTCPLDVEDTIQYVDAGGIFGADYSGVWMDTYAYEDPWGNELRLFYMIPTTGPNYRIIIASAGPNGYWSADAANGYMSAMNAATEDLQKQYFEDDIVMIMEPRQ